MHNLDTMAVSDVETALNKRWYNYIWTLFQRVLNVSKNYIETDRAYDKYWILNR